MDTPTLTTEQIDARLDFAAIPFLITASLSGQDPKTPPGGFAITKLADQPILYSDGYKTLLDIRYPSGVLPKTGWPVLMVVHGGSGHRNRPWVVTVADMMARAGYVTLAYNTGNNGVMGALVQRRGL